MSDYNQFVLAVNKIFEITAKLKQGWKDNDNLNIADSIEESKTTVVEAAKLFNTQMISTAPANPDTTQPVSSEAPQPTETLTPNPANLTPPVAETLTEEVGVLGE